MIPFLKGFIVNYSKTECVAFPKTQFLETRFSLVPCIANRVSETRFYLGFSIRDSKNRVQNRVLPSKLRTEFPKLSF